MDHRWNEGCWKPNVLCQTHLLWNDEANAFCNYVQSDFIAPTNTQWHMRNMRTQSNTCDRDHSTAWQSLKHLPTLGKSLHASLAQYANGSLLWSLLLASLAIILCHTAPLSIIQVPVNFGSKPACEFLWSTSPILLIAQCSTARLYNEVSWGSTEWKDCYYRSRMVGVDSVDD